MKKNVAIIGGGGLVGRELIEIFSSHPYFRLTQITSSEFCGKKISEVFFNIKFEEDLIFSPHDIEIESDTIVCLAVPNLAATTKVPLFLNKGNFVLDFSGAFRLNSLEIFSQFYGIEHSSFDYVEKAVFGMPEIFSKEIKTSKFISNPGCYATSVILPIFLLGEFRNLLKPIIIADCKSGVSGAGGRVEKDTFSFNSIYENFKAYKIFSHQHEPEIARYSFSKDKTLPIPKVIFTPHLLPLYRGILSTIILETKNAEDIDFLKILKRNSKNMYFVRIYDKPEEIELSKVQKTNFIDISLKKRENYIIIVSAIDNLLKGAAGQAVQNLNLAFNFDEKIGLC